MTIPVPHAHASADVCKELLEDPARITYKMIDALKARASIVMMVIQVRPRDTGAAGWFAWSGTRRHPITRQEGKPRSSATIMYSATRATMTM